MAPSLPRAPAAAALLLATLLFAAGLPAAMCQDEYLTQPNERLPRGDADIPCNGEPSCQVCGSVPDVQRACDADNRCQGVTYYPGEGCGYLKSANGPLLSCNHVAAPCVPATHFSRATARRRAAERRDRRLRMLLRHAA